ncbi:MAG TPA: hypothetical protein VH143_25370 [Kofleriaceae bacterium]|jgi:hypothetical protein|nr:hypothetical protein [Kofleriaceae bacterium]
MKDFLGIATPGRSRTDGAASTPGKQTLVESNDHADASTASAHHAPASKDILDEFRETLQKAIEKLAEHGLDKLDPVETMKDKLEAALGTTSCSQEDANQIAATINLLRLRAGWDLLNGLESACNAEIKEVASGDKEPKKLLETVINFLDAAATLGTYATAIGDANRFTAKLQSRCQTNHRQMNPRLRAIPVPNLHYLPHTIVLPPNISEPGGGVIVPVPGALVGGGVAGI